jgi:hypothetical protein
MSSPSWGPRSGIFQVSTKAWDYLVSDPSLLITQVVEWLLQDGWIQASDVAKSRAWVVKKTYSESLEHGFTSGSFLICIKPLRW